MDIKALIVARILLDSISIRKATDQNGVIVEKPDLSGLRDRALISTFSTSSATIPKGKTKALLCPLLFEKQRSPRPSGTLGNEKAFIRIV
jgi:hypothetical protein